MPRPFLGKERINLKLTDNTKKNIEYLKKKWDADTVTEVIRRAIELAVEKEKKQ